MRMEAQTVKEARLVKTIEENVLEVGETRRGNP